MTRCHECHGILSHHPNCPEGPVGDDDLTDEELAELMDGMPRGGSWFYDDEAEAACATLGFGYVPVNQKHEITGALKGPFVLTKVPKVLRTADGKFLKCPRKRYGCVYLALRDLEKLAKTLSAERYYGADVVDQNGVVVAEVE